MATISPILLAAGRSQRFGEQNKLLAPLSLNGVRQALLLHSLHRWLSVVDTISLVIRPQQPLIHQCVQADPLCQSRVRLIEAVEADRGMAHSLVAGIQANRQAAGWLLGLADMPAISRVVIEQSIQSLQRGALITVPLYQQQRGHPVGFAQRYRDELLQLTGDQGAKSLLKAYAENITPITVSDNSICIDVDTPQDLALLSE